MRGFCKETGWPSGNANFPRPIVTEKAFPENELVILPVISHFPEDTAPSVTEGMFKAVYERRFGKRSMFEIDVPWSRPTRSSPERAGLATSRWRLSMRCTPPAQIVSLGMEVSLPSGDRFKDHGSGTPIFEPYVSAGIDDSRLVSADPTESRVSG